ncbi:hypothetical protein H6F67_12630 [Microcoleus sp. FACHB-1515]|uniref:hypothetical protein n=1 Tax=Cyanophyceae TaxID=3028117 RepID=UPI0016872616|nr:hypothetical protein [Microcoleus sp. FACHB-1515]MBD2090700.1 hypothetical protein [Microcoleus sp. FACHB-1515]
MRATHEFIHSTPQITARSNASSSRNPRKEINQLWQQLITFFAGNSDPKIQRIREDNWRVFDPKTNRSLSFTSEQEVRVWLDERYSF